MEAKDKDKVADLLFKRKYADLIVTEQLRLDQVIRYIERAGIREVVEWIESHHIHNGFVGSSLVVYEAGWQAKLKEWGIE